MIRKIGPHTTHHTPHTTHHTPRTTHNTHHTPHTPHTPHTTHESWLSSFVQFSRVASCLADKVCFDSGMNPCLAVQSRRLWCFQRLKCFLKNFTHFFLTQCLTCSTTVNLDTEVHFCLGSSGRGLKESQVGCLMPLAIKDFDHEAPWPDLQFTWSRSDSRAHQSREQGAAWCSVGFLLVCHQR